MENKMKEKVRIAIGIPTYNDVERVNSAIASIYAFTPQEDLLDCKIVVVDDGTPNEKMKDRLRNACNKYDIPLIEHDKNYGIPKAWNSLSRYYDSDIVILFNDDIQVSEPNWLKCMLYFLENNDKVGSVGWPLIHMGKNGLPKPDLPPPNYDTNPGLVGAPVGCAFAFKKSSYNVVPGGFPEQLPSFYEEIFFGMELAKYGYPSYMLPYPAVEHYGSQTFANNPELSVAKPNPSVLSMDKYKEIMLQRFPIERIEPIPGFVYRMDYSRVIFALHFGVTDYWENPQQAVHERMVYPLLGRKIKWLDKNMEEKTGVM